MKNIFSKLALLVAVSLAGCGGGTQDQKPLTYSEFKAAAFVEPDTGVYVINGDELAETEADLRMAYDRYSAQFAKTSGNTTASPLIVNTVGGYDDIWSTSRAVNLTYCVSRSSFGSYYNEVVAAMNEAAAAWEAVARVNFVHDSTQDGNCTVSNNRVLFNVRQVSNVRYLARAFFPSTSRAGREVLVADTAYYAGRYTLAGILRHELGHTIGLRHEHTRPEAAACFENSSWRELTPYDSDSVMHYPQCNGTNQGDLVLTALDQQGVQQLYP